MILRRLPHTERSPRQRSVAGHRPLLVRLAMTPMARPRARLATLRDLDLLVRHRRAMWASIGHWTRRALDLHDRVYRRWAREGLRSGEFLGFLVDDPTLEGAASGCLWLSPSQPRPGVKGLRTPYLLSMYTEPSRRGNGYAREIVRAALRWSAERGYDRVILHASRMGRALYEGAGFEATNEMRRMLRARAPVHPGSKDPRRSRMLPKQGRTGVRTPRTGTAGRHRRLHARR
jgi:GNAT superfamily N-acetyltransferase